MSISFVGAEKSYESVKPRIFDSANKVFWDYCEKYCNIFVLVLKSYYLRMCYNVSWIKPFLVEFNIFLYQIFTNFIASTAKIQEM